MPLLAEVKGKDRSTIYESLYVLEKQGYIAKRYDKTYKLLLRPAEYYLLGEGIRYLRDNTDIAWTALRNLYKNKSADQTLIDNCLGAMTIHLKLRDIYPNTFVIWSKTEASQADWLPRPLPSLYLMRNRPKAEANHHYMVQIVEAGLPRYILVKILRSYQNHCDNYWDEDEQGNYPDLLLITRNERTEQRLLPIIEYMLQDFEIYTTTIDRLLAATNNKIWAYAFDQGLYEPMVLRGL